MEQDFQAFWAALPSPMKVGKKVAHKEYAKARREASADDIASGLDRYLRSKPTWQNYCHPRTFLSQGRWMDETDTTTARRSWREDCPHTPPCGNATNCTNLQTIAAYRARRAG